MGERRLVISMGDPTGIGPEVTVKALAHWRRGRDSPPILVGDLQVFRTAAVRLRVSLPLQPWTPGTTLPSRAIPVREIAALAPRERRPGQPTLAGGRAAYRAVVEAVNLISQGYADALVTAPICKANLVAAGVRTTGHTELLAAMTGAEPVRMMMVGSRLRVTLATTHLALSRVPRALSREGVYDTIRVTHAALREHLGVAQPRIGVAGLNPHAGEGGLFGNEEKRLIAPAVERARRHRIDVAGPLAADSLFAVAAGRFDALVCMYHDQGLGPFKLLHFADGVNFTAGLPFIRTSPDHGTAHDIAGRGLADPRSMVAALTLAAQRGRARRAA